MYYTLKNSDVAILHFVTGYILPSIVWTASDDILKKRKTKTNQNKKQQQGPVHNF